MFAAQNGIVSHVVMNVILTMACVLVMRSMMIHSVIARVVSLAKIGKPIFHYAYLNSTYVFKLSFLGLMETY